MIRSMRRYLTGEKGVAFIEFALVLPILLLLFVGALEITRFIMANQKVDKASHGIANFLSMQEDPLSVPIGQIDAAFQSLISPFGSSVAGFRVLELRPDLNNQQADGYPLRVEDTEQSGAVGGTQIGNAGGPVTGADVRDIRVEQSEFLVGVETYLNYSSIVPGVSRALANLGLGGTSLDNQQLYKRSVVRHRLANFEIMNGRPAGPVNPECCGVYCSDDGQPECACRGGTTCSLSDANRYARCTYRGASNCTGGGGGPNPPNCTQTNSCGGGGS